MKAALFTVMRVLLIICVGAIGLFGLLMSACGGLYMLGGGMGTGFGWVLFWGLCATAAAVGLTLWISRAANRTVLVVFLIVFLPLLAFIAYRLSRH